MRANYVGNTALQERLHRPSPEVQALVEAVVAENEDIRETNDEWSGSGSGLFFPEIGGARLIRDTDATHAVHDTASADQENVTTDLDNASPWFMLELEWSEIGSPDFEIHNLTLTLDPDVDGTGREVSEFRVQLFRAAEESENEVVLEPIGGRASAAVSGNAQDDFSFDLSGGEVGEPPEPGDSPEEEEDFDDVTNPKTYIKVWAVTSDGSAAGNVAWVGDPDDSATSTLVDDGTIDVAQATFRELRELDSPRRNVGGRFEKFGVGSGLPDFSLDGKSYTQATATFDTIDLGSAPLSGTDLVVVAQGEEPSDSSLKWEISDDDGSSWQEVADGDVIGEDNTDDGGFDLSGLSRQQTYDARVTLSPSSDGHTSPFARRLGVEEVTTTLLPNTASVTNAGNWAFDPVTLKGEIPEATIELLKDGVRDYRSEGERIFADHHIGDVNFRVWIGSLDLDRRYWLHVDTFEVDDYSSEGGSIEVTGLSPTRRLKTGVPPYDVSAQERTPTEYTNVTLKAAWDDLLDSEVGLPGRYRGPGVEDTTSQSVSKTLRDSDGKTELDAIAHLAGGTVVPSQGRVKFQNTFADDQGGVRASFPMEEIRVTGVTPGYRNRVDEYFVRYAFEEDRDDFDGEVRSFHSPSITKLGGRGLDMEERLDESVSRWIPTPTKDPNNMTDAEKTDPSVFLASAIARRTTSPNGLGPGLKQVRFKSTIPHPELEPGDVVVVETDQLVLKDPATDIGWRGVLWLTGVIQAQHDVMGEQFTVWVQQIEDAIPDEEDGDNSTGGGSGADTIYPTVDENITETNSTGSLDLDVVDEQNRVTAIEFQKKTDASGFSGTWVSTWDRSTGAIGTDTALARGEDIAMDDEHNFAIKYRVQFTGKSGSTHTKSGSAVFDTDESANVNVSAYLDTEGDLIATIRGGPDVDTGQAPSLKLWAGTTPPDTSTTPDYTADNVQEVEGVDTGLDFNNTFVYVVAKGVNSRGEDGPPDKTLALSNPADPVPPFNVTVSENRASASASVSVDINGSESYDIEILQVEPDGTSTSLVSNTSVTDGGAGDPTTANPSLSEKVSTILKVVVKNSTTGETLHEETHTFDPLEKPDFSTFTAEANEQGQIKVTALGDADTASWKIEYDFTGDGTVDETSTGNGTGVLETSSGKIPRETTGDVTVTLYTQTGQSGGTTSDTAEVTFKGGYPQNLLGTDAGPEQSGTGELFHAYLTSGQGGDLATLGLEIGDRISGSLQPRSDTGADRVRIYWEFWDATDTIISNHRGTSVTSSSYGARSTLENVEIPANTAYIKVFAQNRDETETAYARRAMLNRGPSAAPFDEPPIRRQREGQVIEAGLLRNQADDDGVVLSGAVPSGWSRWLNLSDANEPFLKHENIELRQNGDAVFTGTLSAATGSIGTLDIADDLFLGTSHDIRWGTQASPTTVTKSMVLGPQGFTPADDGTAWNQNLIYISTNDLNESFYFAPVLVAPGVEITALRARVFANDVSQDTTEVALYRANRTAQTNTLVSSTLSPSADATWETVSDTSITETVADDVYLVRFRGDAASATTACRVAWVELDYDVSNLRQSI